MQKECDMAPPDDTRSELKDDSVDLKKGNTALPGNTGVEVEDNCVDLTKDARAQEKGKRKYHTGQVFYDGSRDPSLNEPASLDTATSNDSSTYSAELLIPDTHVTLTYLKRCVKNNDEYHCKVIAELRYENEVLKATVRQYMCKVKKIKRLALAAIDRDEDLFEGVNANLERGKILKGEIKSDNEDDAQCNQVKYSGYSSDSD